MNGIMNHIAASFDDGEAFLLALLGIWIFSVLIGIVGILFNHLLQAIPLYIMADKAGYRYPFLAFLPVANYYLMHIMPLKEYSYLGMFKSYDRKKGFFFFIAVRYVGYFMIWAIAMFFSFIPLLSIIGSLLSSFLNLILYFLSYSSLAIMRIDYLELYMPKNKTTAKVLGIISVFVPMMFTIVCYVICCNEPEFGFGNYYNLKSFAIEED